MNWFQKFIGEKVLPVFNKSIWHRIGLSFLAFVLLIISFIGFIIFWQYSIPLAFIVLVIAAIHNTIWKFYDTYF